MKAADKMIEPDERELLGAAFVEIAEHLGRARVQAAEAVADRADLVLKNDRLNYLVATGLQEMSKDIGAKYEAAVVERDAALKALAQLQDYASHFIHCFDSDPHIEREQLTTEYARDWLLTLIPEKPREWITQAPAKDGGK